MPLYIDKSADYDSTYPPAFPVMTLNDDASVGTYSMSSVRDYSGNGNNLITVATFNSEGMVCTQSGTSAEIPAQESESITVVIAVNIPSAPAEVRNIISTITPATSPYEGFRLTQGTTGSGSILVATGAASPTSNSMSIGGVTGGWTAFAFTITNTRIAFLRSSGSSGSLDITQRAISTNNIFVNGAPAGSQITDGIDGTIGCLAIYDREMTSAEMATEINNMRVFMATKGVTIP